MFCQQNVYFVSWKLMNDFKHFQLADIRLRKGGISSKRERSCRSFGDVAGGQAVLPNLYQPQRHQEEVR